MLAHTAHFLLIAAATGALAQSSGSNSTNATSSAPSLRLEHQFFLQMPTGITLTSNGTMFVNYPIALNTSAEANSTSVYTVARLTGNSTDVPFPSAEYNRPTGGYINASNPGYATGDADHLVSVQNVVVDYKDRIWALDTGRPMVANQMLLSSYGGPKLVGFAANGTVLRKIVFPRNTVFADSYLNDVRFDLRSNVTSSGQGIAYITDSSNEGRNGIIIVDLGTGESWRHLNGVQQTRVDTGFNSSYNGQPFTPLYPDQVGLGQGQYGQLLLGADGIALSPASRRLYTVPTSYLLRRPNVTNPRAAQDAIQNTRLIANLTSHADGIETDSSGLIYQGAPERNAIGTVNATTGQYRQIVQDDRIQWPDTLFITNERRLYFTTNSYWKQPAFNNGTDLRAKPYSLYSIPIDNGRINLQ